MITENISNLQIHKLTREQYEAALTAGTLDENALYLTPDSDDTAIPTKVSDLENDSGYATQTYVDEAISELSSSSSSLLDAYPVGSVYISYVSTSPASLFGGTWTAITGVFPYFNAGTATGGSNTHTLTTDEMPSHEHSLYWQGSSGTNSRIYGNDDSCFDQGRYGTYNGLVTAPAGGGGSHNNMPAYQTFYAWRRTA